MGDWTNDINWTIQAVDNESTLNKEIYNNIVWCDQIKLHFTQCRGGVNEINSLPSSIVNNNDYVLIPIPVSSNNYIWYEPN